MNVYYNNYRHKMNNKTQIKSNIILDVLQVEGILCEDITRFIFF